MISTMPANVQPGSEVRVTLTLSGSANVAGVFIATDQGSLSTVPGQGLASTNGGLTHSSPRSISGGEVAFVFDWQVPDEPGAARFTSSSVFANGNGNSGGDGGASHLLDVVFGCDAQEFFRDFDGDGFGRASESRVFCEGEVPPGYAVTGDDCDDNRDTTYPGAVELCNLRDDDCNEAIDDDAIPVEQYPDGDGDGFYSPIERESGKTFVGCVPSEGWAADPGDCAPDDETRNPEAEEVCNLYDDNCDGRVDEKVRPTCGTGWCRREAPTCDAALCVPGEPVEETCNLLDDDCDGLIDEDAPCEAGTACIAGECREEDAFEPSGTGTSTGAGDGESSASNGPTADTDSPSAASGDGGCTIGGSPAPFAWLLISIVAATRRRRG